MQSLKLPELLIFVQRAAEARLIASVQVPYLVELALAEPAAGFGFRPNHSQWPRHARQSAGGLGCRRRLLVLVLVTVLVMGLSLALLVVRSQLFRLLRLDAPCAPVDQISE